jgi:uncharacterized Tic20 family protein
MTTKPTRAVPDQRDGPDDGQRVRDGDVTWATFGYLGAVFLGPVVPLVVYLIKAWRSPFLRYHAATAANLSLTGVLYGLCCAIAGGVLLLDSLTVALVIALPLGFLFWMLLLRQLVRGVIAASRGEEFAVPSWLCARFIR